MSEIEMAAETDAEMAAENAADEGAFPEGTIMQVAEVNDESTIETIASAAGGDTESVEAVDITFVDVEGNIVNPQIPIRVVMTSQLVQTAADSVVVHVDHDGNTEVIDQVEDPQAAGADAVAFDAEAFSIYAVVGTTIEKTVLASDGHNYKVTVSCGPEAGIPEGASDRRLNQLYIRWQYDTGRRSDT